MHISTRSKALLLCGVVFAICLVSAVHFLNAGRQITVIGGADGPTAVFLATGDSLSPEEKQALADKQLQMRLQAALTDLESVESAHVALGDGSASVNLLLAPGTSLSQEQCTGIKALVCAATGIPEETVELSVF